MMLGKACMALRERLVFPVSVLRMVKNLDDLRPQEERPRHLSADVRCLFLNSSSSQFCLAVCLTLLFMTSPKLTLIFQFAELLSIFRIPMCGLVANVSSENLENE